jgi:hypothetical protein
MSPGITGFLPLPVNNAQIAPVVVMFPLFTRSHGCPQFLFYPVSETSPKVLVFHFWVAPPSYTTPFGTFRNCKLESSSTGHRAAESITATGLAPPMVRHSNRFAYTSAPRPTSPAELVWMVPRPRPCNARRFGFQLPSSFALFTHSGYVLRLSPLPSFKSQTSRHPSNLRSPSGLSSFRIVALGRRQGLESLP